MGFMLGLIGNRSKHPECSRIILLSQNYSHDVKDPSWAPLVKEENYLYVKWDSGVNPSSTCRPISPTSRPPRSLILLYILKGFDLL